MINNNPPICTSYVRRRRINCDIMTEYRTYIYNRQDANLPNNISKSFGPEISSLETTFKFIIHRTLK